MAWTHTPRLPVLIFMLWAFPFTIWDTLYLYLRPNSLPGYKWHVPYFSGTFTTWAGIDQSYGEQGWKDRDGFVSAQSVINMLEVTLYMIYVSIVWQSAERLFGAKISGRSGGLAVLVGMNAGCVTATKTSLYFMREIFSGLKYTGQAEWRPFLVVWGGMNLLYFSVSSYMIYIFGKDVLNGFEDNSKAKLKAK